MKMHLKISSAKWQPFCPGGDELTTTVSMWVALQCVLVLSDTGQCCQAHRCLVSLPLISPLQNEASLKTNNWLYNNGILQDCSISSAFAMEILQFMKLLTLRFVLVNTKFGSSCQPIRTNVRKSLLIIMNIYMNCFSNPGPWHSNH